MWVWVGVGGGRWWVVGGGEWLWVLVVGGSPVGNQPLSIVDMNIFFAYIYIYINMYMGPREYERNMKGAKCFETESQSLHSKGKPYCCGYKSNADSNRAEHETTMGRRRAETRRRPPCFVMEGFICASV